MFSNDGRMTMADIFGSMGNGVKPKPVGRIVTGFNHAILGLESKTEGLKPNTVYEIRSNPFTGLTLVEVGESHVDFDNSNLDISSTLLTHNQKLILTKEELVKFEKEGN